MRWTGLVLSFSLIAFIWWQLLYIITKRKESATLGVLGFIISGSAGIMLKLAGALR